MVMMKMKEKRGERKTASEPARERERCLKHKCLVLGGKKAMICAEAKKQIRANLRDSRYGQKQQHSICEARGQRSMPVLAVPEERYLSLALVMAAAAINTTTT
jgi:ribosome assembly protein YihI (activator of Der GTPase)